MIVDRYSLGRLEPYWHRTRVWWNERSLREQILLGTLAALAALALLLLIIAPLRTVREEARADIRDAALLEARIRAGGASPIQAGTFRSGTPSAILTDSAAAAAITIARMEQEGGNTRVVLADMPFGQVLQWLAELERSSRLRVRAADLERTAAPGIVTASIVVEG